MNGLDGNAAGAMLFDAYGVEMTAVVGRCESCGRVAALAETAAYLRPASVVLRCTNCDAVLVVVVERRGVACVDRRGISFI
jgi:phage FluMu protein Com